MKKKVCILVWGLIMGVFFASGAYAAEQIVNAAGEAAVSEVKEEDLNQADVPDQAGTKVQLDEIVITAARIPQKESATARSMEVITSTDIAESNAGSVGDLLEDIAGVHVNDYGSLGAVNTAKIRGSTAAQVLVLIDGRPVNSPRDGELDLSTVSLADVERIEILRGPASSLYGSSAMGGTIHIITKRPPREGFSTAMESSFGTFRTYIERLRHGGRVGKFGYLVAGEYQDSEGARQNSEYTAKSSNVKLDYQINEENVLFFNSGFFRSKIGAPGLTSTFDNDDLQRKLTRFGSLDWSYDAGDDTHILTKIYRTHDRLEFAENTAGSVFDTAFQKDIHTTRQSGLDMHLSHRLTDWYRGIVGFNYVRNVNDSTATAKHKYNVRAWFLENQFDPFEKLSLTLGGRVDDYSNFGSELSPDVSFLFRATEKLRLRGRMSRSFRAPTFNDLYWPDEIWIVGNPQLKPERGTTGELGFDLWLSDFMKFKFSVYRSEFDDLIQWAPDSAFVWTPQNVGEAVIKGAETDLTLFAGEHLTFDAGYSYVSAKDSASNKYLVYQPRHKVSLSGKYDNLKGFVVVLRGTFVDERYHDSANSISVKHYYLFGLDLSRRFT
ncbi:MAG: TonB-dependent receptor, partial [Candidatus Omnitrophica bacterium]|nr:TonB-dependent receptor [Candidatus Omnitrophota bacterium]